MVFDIFLTLFLVFLNGFFVATEFALVKVRSSQIELKVKEGNRFAVMSKSILKKLDSYLAATQLGITLASLGLGWIGERVMVRVVTSIFHAFSLRITAAVAHSIAIPVAFAIITVLHIVFGELAPKSLAIQRSLGTTLAVAYPIRAFYIMFRPFIWLLNGIANFMLKLIGIKPVHGAEVHSADELKFLVEQGKESGSIESLNYEIINNAFDFTNREVRHIMIPRTQAVALNLHEKDLNEFDRVLEEGYSRIPVFAQSIDNIIGVIHTKDLLKELRKSTAISVEKLLRPVISVPETKKINELLRDFQTRHLHMAVVVDDYGGTAGILTMEDIIEELVGEIQDENDDEPVIAEKISEDTYNVIPTASIEDINELLPRPISNEYDFDSFAGLLLSKFGKIPLINEKVILDNYECTVLKRKKRIITLVQLRNLAPIEEKAES